MTTWIVEVALVALFALTCGALVVASQHGRLAFASLTLFAAAAVVWALEFVALVTAYRGADGFATCTTQCTAVHYVSAVAFLVPPLLMALSACAMLVTLARRIRVRRADAREATG